VKIFPALLSAVTRTAAEKRLTGSAGLRPATYAYDSAPGSKVATRPGTERIGPDDTYRKTLYRIGTTDTAFYTGQFGVETAPCSLRFINADPIGFSGGSNWYAYAGNRPLMAVDRSGVEKSLELTGGKNEKQ
jgi:uncharacterized protein RhaS with RHS repeats